ncbi:MAG: hypothetical protein ACRDA4_10630 [Filifactoraceae bacterium]
MFIGIKDKNKDLIINLNRVDVIYKDEKNIKVVLNYDFKIDKRREITFRYESEKEATEIYQAIQETLK